MTFFRIMLKVYFIPGENYLNILQRFFDEYLYNLPLNDYRRLFYQHDGAPPHNSHSVSNFLDSVFHDQWIGNNGPFLWPPRSPDLSVLDFFIWGALKNKIYEQPLTTKEDCIRRVQEAFSSLTRASINAATHKQLIIRCVKCLEVAGRNFEHLLK